MSENKVIKFDLDPKTLKVKELLNKDFLELEIKAISTAKPNRNGSHFTLESLQKAIPSFYNKPILGSFSVSRDDFRGHEGELEWDSELGQLYYDYTDDTAETPLGMIRGTDKIEIYRDKKDGLDWLKFTCAIWVKYNYKQVKKLLKSKDGHKKISVEVEVNDYEFDENGIEIIKDFTFDGVTILGDNLETGIADANLTILDMIDNALFQKKQKCLCYAYDNMNKNETPEIEVVETEVQDSDNIFSSEIVSNENSEEIEMNQENQEGGKQKMLTYESKRSLLESYLNKIFNGECEEGKDCCYAWVCDLDESNVYFNYMGEFYRAGYLILEGDEQGEGSVSVDFEAKEQVVRSWSVFAAESSEESEEKKCEDESCNEEDCEKKTCEENEDEKPAEDSPAEEDMAAEDKACEEKVCEESDEENKEVLEEQPAETPDDSNDDSDDESDDKDDDDKDDDKDDDNHDTFADANEPIELNDEPTVTDIENKSMEEIIETSTESIVAPEVQVEAEDLGDANAQATEVLDSNVTEIIADDSINTITESVGVGPDGQEAVVVDAETEVEAPVEQPDDNEKEAIFEAVEDVVVTAEVVTVEVDGENLDINTLLEKYNSLKGEFEALNQTVKSQKAQALAQFAADFINADSDVDEDARKSYIQQISEKCLSYEFTSEDEIVKFAKSLLAMYYYENKVSKKETSDFSFSIEHPVHVEKNVSSNKLKDAINKLNLL